MIRTSDDAPKFKASIIRSLPARHRPREPQTGPERRRDALRNFMGRRGLTPRDLAHICGMPSPNAFYNLINGYSASLAVETLELILRSVPGSSFEELVGLSPRDSDTLAPARQFGDWPTILISQLVAENIWDLAGRQTLEPFRLQVAMPELAPDAFGAFVAAGGGSGFYPEGAVLIARPLAAWKGVPPLGRAPSSAGNGQTVSRSLVGNSTTTTLTAGLRQPVRVRANSH